MELKKKYSSGEVTVVWKPSLCFHSKNCFKGLPEVFNPDQRPWIQVDKANAQQIMDQVEQCPSGALSYFRNNAKIEKDMDEEVRVQVMPNGSLMVHSSVNVEHADGNTEKRTRKSAFCRCGGSSKKPFCDGTHTKIGFEG
ncbi:MAG: (4Fe-4S)-binding protein [Owenweeksia sp.]|nr:(4Fe-4S)-binding protein [Owenweeksia sp.]